MDISIIEKLSALIKDPTLEQLTLNLSKPNLFEILKISNTEIRHSNFLAWLLSPSQSHQLRDTFLKWFLKDIFSDSRVEWIDEFSVDSIDTSKLIIHREFRHIDLVLETNDFIVVIENKMWSKEHSNQLTRYKKIIQKEFPLKEHAFVFLTPYSHSPEQEEDKDLYVSYGYESIIRILDIILGIYGHSLSEKISIYINDYIEILRRNVMQEDEATKIAQEIYKNHKEALDFIFQKKPDLALKFGEVFDEVIQHEGYILGTQGKGYCRFTTPKLNELLPKSKLPGWNQSESFLFEIRFYTSKVIFTCVVPPSQHELREKLLKALKTVEGAKNSKSTKWSTVHNHNWNINLEIEKYDDLALLKEDIEKKLSKEREFIFQIEQAIISEFNGY
ncbi:PD-(D/E)XK nuclease family protein [Glaciecola sp. 1036]|uniref:PDDEXK-like family protein n=1 Tax=Alteromonadaceae TaxID=72275 RepID=UPI003CFFF3B6